MSQFKPLLMVFNCSNIHVFLTVLPKSHNGPMTSNSSKNPHDHGLVWLTMWWYLCTSEEIEGIVKRMKPDKTQGPDWFNESFLKHCWHIVKKEFIQLRNGFYSGATYVESIKCSFITLVPKKQCPETVNDFSHKYLFKVPHKAFCQQILESDHKKHKYIGVVFIKDRTIHDSLGWPFEFTHECQ